MSSFEILTGSLRRSSLYRGISSSIKSAVKAVVPKQLHLPMRYFKYYIAGDLDRERKVLRELCPRCKRAIDVGANHGIYSYSFSRYCADVEAFEPVDEFTGMLKSYAGFAGNIRVHPVGLSDSDGVAEIFTPLIQGSNDPDVGLTSLSTPEGGRYLINKISLRKLDDYKFRDVDIIKIDVEGHEFEVLKGAARTIEDNKPIVMIEVEQRHHRSRDIREVFEFIQALGYDGFFLQEGELRSISRFSVAEHQEPYLDCVHSKEYVNNFIFRPV